MLKLLIINSLFIFGWHYCTLFDLESTPTGNMIVNKEVAWWFRFFIGNVLDECNIVSLAKPMYGCVVCMASIYGTIGYWSYSLITHHLSLITFLLWPVYVVALAGLNRLLKNLCQI